MGWPIVRNGDYVAKMCMKTYVRPVVLCYMRVSMVDGQGAVLGNLLSISYYGIFECVGSGEM